VFGSTLPPLPSSSAVSAMAAAAQAVAKGSVVSPSGNRAAPGLLGRRMAPSAVRIGAPWRKTAFLGGGRLAVGPMRSRSASRTLVASPVQMNMNLAIGKSMRWWEKGLQPNMREVESAQDLADSLANAGDRLVIVDFLPWLRRLPCSSPKDLPVCGAESGCAVLASEL